MLAINYSHQIKSLTINKIKTKVNNIAHIHVSHNKTTTKT